MALIPEIYKDINEFEGFYKISNYGKVRSLDRINCCGKTVKGRLLKLHKDIYGYSIVCLSKDGARYYFKVHRLVAEAFIPNPENKPTVNHKNEFEKANNYVENLEWATYKEQINYGTLKARQVANHNYYSEDHLNARKSAKRPIAQYDSNMNFIKEWDSATDVELEIGIKACAVCGCLRGKHRTHKGCIWKYA